MFIGVIVAEPSGMLHTLRRMLNYYNNTYIPVITNSMRVIMNETIYANGYDEYFSKKYYDI